MEIVFRTWVRLSLPMMWVVDTSSSASCTVIVRSIRSSAHGDKKTMGSMVMHVMLLSHVMITSKMRRSMTSVRGNSPSTATIRYISKL